MEYGRREPMKSTSAKEPTAFTMKTIQELLAEEIAAGGADPTQPVPQPEAGLQMPPHLRAPSPQPPINEIAATNKAEPIAGTAPQVEAERNASPMAMPPVEIAADQPPAETTPPAQPKSRSFLRRLIGG